MPDDIVMWLPAMPEAVPTARSRVRRFVRLPPAREDDLALAVSEVVTLAVAAQAPSDDRRIEVRVARGSDRVRVTVRAFDVGFPDLTDPQRPDLGLSRTVLEAIADGWGHHGDALWIEVGSGSRREERRGRERLRAASPLRAVPSPASASREERRSPEL